MNNALVVQYMSPYMIILLLQLCQHSLSLHIYLSSDTNNFTVTTCQKTARLTQCNSTLTTTLNMWTEQCHHRKAWTNKGCYKAKSLQIVNLTAWPWHEALQIFEDHKELTLLWMFLVCWLVVWVNCGQTYWDETWHKGRLVYLSN